MIVQVRCVNAVVRGFAAGLRWASAERVVLQLISNWTARSTAPEEHARDQLNLVLKKEERKKKKKKGKRKQMTLMAQVRTVTGEGKRRLRRSGAVLKEWETRQKVEIGAAVRKACRVSPLARQVPAREKSVPPSAGQQDEGPRIRCDR